MADQLQMGWQDCFALLGLLLARQSLLKTSRVTKLLLLERLSMSCGYILCALHGQAFQK